MTSILKQRHALIDRFTYEISDDEIIITRHALTSGESARFNLFDLSESTSRVFRIEWGWVVLAILFFLFSIPFINDALSLKAFYPVYPAMALWLISLIFVFVYTYKSYDKIIFKRWQDDVPVFFIYNNNPDRDSFHDFYSQLTEKIRKTRVNPKLSAPQKLEVYSKHLQFLVDEDVISPQEAKDIYERKRMRMDMEKSGITGIVPDKE